MLQRLECAKSGSWRIDEYFPLALPLAGVIVVH